MECTSLLGIALSILYLSASITISPKANSFKDMRLNVLPGPAAGRPSESVKCRSGQCGGGRPAGCRLQATRASGRAFGRRDEQMIAPLLPSVCLSAARGAPRARTSHWERQIRRAERESARLPREEQMISPLSPARVSTMAAAVPAIIRKVHILDLIAHVYLESARCPGDEKDQKNYVRCELTRL